MVKAITGPLPSFSEKSEREMIAAGNRRDRIKESIYNYYITRRGLREKFINRINEIIDSLGASPCDYTSSEKETKLYNIFVRNYLKSVKIENEVGHGIENAESYLN